MKRTSIRKSVFFSVEDVLVLIDVLVLRLRGIIIMQVC